MSEPFDPYLHWLGIRDLNRPPNHYRLLGVDLFENDGDVLANAADRQMAHVRTFQTGKHSAESQRLLNELATAKVCLLNAAKKAEYDAALRAQPAPPLPPLVGAAAPAARALTGGGCRACGHFSPAPAGAFQPAATGASPRGTADGQFDRPVVRDVRGPDIDRVDSLVEPSPQRRPDCREQGKVGSSCGCPAGQAQTGRRPNRNSPSRSR